MLIALADRAADKNSSLYDDWGSNLYRYQLVSEDITRFFAHGEKFSMVFADGHLQAERPESMLDKSHWYRRGY